MSPLNFDPAELIDALNRASATLDRDDTLVYRVNGPHSYYRDLLAYHGVGQSGGHEARLQQHAEQSEHIAEQRHQWAERELRMSGLEYRVEPNRLDGQGGFFDPPAWLNQLFATANRPALVLGRLVSHMLLPAGVASLGIPVIATGSNVSSATDTAGPPSQDIADMAATAVVTPMVGYVDVAMQTLEMSPVAAAVDWAFFRDLSEATDAALEYQLIMGIGGTGIGAQLLGVAQVPNVNAITYTDATPSGLRLYPYLGRAFAQIGDNRKIQPECFLMRSNRWANIKTSEDSTGLPLDISGVMYLGSTTDTPDPIGGLLGLPTFLSDAIPNNLTATTANNVTTFAQTGTQDLIIALRPTEVLLLEGDTITSVDREPLSAAGGVRLVAHRNAAALTGRRPASISVISGTGLATPTGF